MKLCSTHSNFHINILKKSIEKLNDARRYREAIAWEFLRRNAGYQRDWSNWFDYRELYQIRNSNGFFHSIQSSARSLQEKYLIETEFEKPPDSFRGLPPLYASQLARASNVGLLAYRENNSDDNYATLQDDPIRLHIDYRIYLESPIDIQLLLLRDEILKRKKRPQSRLCGDKYITYLRILDGLSAGASKHGNCSPGRLREVQATAKRPSRKSRTVSSAASPRSRAVPVMERYPA